MSLEGLQRWLSLSRDQSLDMELTFLSNPKALKFIHKILRILLAPAHRWRTVNVIGPTEILAKFMRMLDRASRLEQFHISTPFLTHSGVNKLLYYNGPSPGTVTAEKPVYKVPTLKRLSFQRIDGAVPIIHGHENMTLQILENFPECKELLTLTTKLVMINTNLAQEWDLPPELTNLKELIVSGLKWPFCSWFSEILAKAPNFEILDIRLYESSIWEEGFQNTLRVTDLKLRFDAGGNLSDLITIGGRALCWDRDEGIKFFLNFPNLVHLFVEWIYSEEEHEFNLSPFLDSLGEDATSSSGLLCPRLQSLELECVCVDISTLENLASKRAGQLTFTLRGCYTLPDVQAVDGDGLLESLRDPEQVNLPFDPEDAMSGWEAYFARDQF